MGNCLVLEEKVVRVMKTDGKILEYKSPIKVHQVLSEFTHHAISDKLPPLQHLHPNSQMLPGHLYYLLPLPPPVEKKKKKTNKMKKTVKFADDVVEKENRANGFVRIKVVISKQELQAMLTEGGISVADMVSKVKNEISREDEVISKGFSPALESIPEVD